MTIEHGHANNFENDYSSVAYWYQLEPHAPFPQLLSVKERIPYFPEEFFVAEKKRAELNQWSQQALAAKGGQSASAAIAVRTVGDLRSSADRMFNEYRFQDACAEYDRCLRIITSLVTGLESK